MVKISSNASLIPSFRAQFDPDGYGTGDYNEVENRDTDRIVNIQERNATMTRTVTIPEFSQIVVPIAIPVMVFTFMGRSKRLSPNNH
ncbi:MAG: hypothetical protein ACE5KV_04825 [Thermoplasmata archaeon]